MIFLSAQPDSAYFMWQIELQLFHLCQSGWAKENIHVLISYNPNIGLSLQAESLIERFPSYRIFLYLDTRKNKSYASTIRPHIIEKHFEFFPSLRKETIFYIDSDVIFREIPNFSNLLVDKYWYASNTKSYMSCNIIINILGYDIFCKMCEIIKISPELVIKEEKSTGGAQYIIKDVPTWFWPKVEEDSNNLYNFLYELLYTDTNHNFYDRQPLDIWITEMWVVCWNAILAKKPFVVHPMLDFCWANQSKERWEETYILHYTGGGQGNFFRKTDFVLSTPFYTDLSYISDEYSSAQLKKLITSYRLCLNKDRILMDDVTMVIPVNTDHLHTINNIEYLLKYIDTNIIVIEMGKLAKINPENLPKNVMYKHYINVNTSQCILENITSLNITTNYLSIIPSNCILPINQIVDAVDKLRNNIAKAVYPFDTQLKTDILTTHIFSKVLEDAFLLSNIGKLSPLNKSLELCPIFMKSRELIDFLKEVQFDDDTCVARAKGYLFVSKN